MTRICNYIVFCLSLLFSEQVVAQGTMRAPDTTRIDTMLMIDTSRTAKPERFRKFDHKKKSADLESRRRPAFSFSDSVTAHFGSARYDQKPAVDRFTFRNSGDYFRYVPQFFVQSYQEVPMRTTVAPFGLPGNRISWAPSGRTVTPFEHVPVYDGMVDAEDFPSATDHSAFVIPGPIGLLYGGHEVAAALVTRPMPLTTTDPQSALLVNKGDYGYAMTRGRLDKLYGDGRRADLSVEYRKTDGLLSSRADNSYHYTGDFYVPVGSSSAIETDGWLYTRDGAISVNPDSTIGRYRFDRHFGVSWLMFDSARISRLEIGYRHARQGSHMDRSYRDWLDQTSHTAIIKREWVGGATLFRGNAEVTAIQYRNRTGAKDRTTGDLSFSALRTMGGWRSAATVGSRYTKTYNALPYGMATVMRDNSRSFLHLSVGYLEQAPTQHDLHLPYNISTFRSSGIYTDSGNPALVPEKQLIATAYAEYGTVDNAIGVSVAGGKINDAIDWVRFEAADTVTHSPRNVTLNFTDIAGLARFRIADFARFNSGVGYQHLTRSDNRPQYYAPDISGFSGLELHWFWASKLIHFFAYGELVYTGEYAGYIDPSMGEQVTANARLSFAMGQFRFNYDIRNSFQRDYPSRDGLYLNGRFVSWGFVWSFVN
jgi:hypothetical protein